MGSKPLCVDLFAGLGGWSEGFLAEGYWCVGFDIERHDYGSGGYPGDLVLQDVATLHGSQFKDATVIVASPPCQEYSYRAMPWKRAKALPPPSNDLFDACFRIQREACEASGRTIPLVVENVKGAQPWVGRAAWHFGSFYLWGDVPALMPVGGRQKHPKGKSAPRNWSERDALQGGDWWSGTKNTGGSWFAIANNTESGHSRNPVNGLKRPGQSISDGFNNWPKNEFGEYVMPDGSTVAGTKGFAKRFEDTPMARYSSRSIARKIASAQIAKIPLPLSSHIARVYRNA